MPESASLIASPAPAAPAPAPSAPSAPSAPAAPPIAAHRTSAPGSLAQSSPEPTNPFSDADFAAEAKKAVEGSGEGATPPPKPSGDAKPAAAPPSSPKPAAASTEVQRTPKELRLELERTRTELDSHKQTAAQLEAKIREYEARGKDADSLRAALESKDKRIEELEGERRALKQEASPEFKKQYEEPFNRAADYADLIVRSIVKVDGTPADFDKDFVPIYRAAHSNYGKAAAEARELFGEDSAPAVMDQVRELRRLEVQKNRALDEEKKGWAEKQKIADGQRVQQREQFKETWQKVNKDLAETVEGYRDPVDDKEAADLRQKAYAIFDADPRTPQESILKGAHVRHRVAAFGPNQLTIARQKAEIEALKQQLETHKPKQPGARNQAVGGDKPQAEPEDWATAALRAVPK